MARHHGHLGVASRLREEFAFTRTFQGTAIRLDSPIDLVFQRKKTYGCCMACCCCMEVRFKVFLKHVWKVKRVK